MWQDKNASARLRLLPLARGRFAALVDVRPESLPPGPGDLGIPSQLAKRDSGPTSESKSSIFFLLPPSPTSESLEAPRTRDRSNFPGSWIYKSLEFTSLASEMYRIVLEGVSIRH